VTLVLTSRIFPGIRLSVMKVNEIAMEHLLRQKDIYFDSTIKNYETLLWEIVQWEERLGAAKLLLDQDEPDINI